MKWLTRTMLTYFSTKYLMGHLGFEMAEISGFVAYVGLFLAMSLLMDWSTNRLVQVEEEQK